MSRDSDNQQPTLADVEARALRYLGRRDHAEGELRAKLRKKDFPDELIDQVCAKMRSYGYLDDRRFADQQVAILVRKNWGPRQISHKLRKRGVDQSIIDEVVDDQTDADTWVQSCRGRIESKFRKGPAELDDKEKQKAWRHLNYRGFWPATIRRVLFDDAGA